ncbi:MAG: tyrosine-type recombinase/integrase [Pseudomonadota bacterium]
MNEVEAVKTKAEIATVEHLLRKHKGDLYGDIWRIGVNLALRISDLLAIEYAAMDMERRELRLVEGKTAKVRHLRLNNTVYLIVERRRGEHPTDTYLFQVHSNRTQGLVKPVGRVTVAKAFKEVGDILRVRLGTHSMRKSRGWAMYSDGVPIEMIAKVLNHSSPSVTMAYLGITKAEVLQTYLDYEL